MIKYENIVIAYQVIYNIYINTLYIYKGNYLT